MDCRHYTVLFDNVSEVIFLKPSVIQEPEQIRDNQSFHNQKTVLVF